MSRVEGTYDSQVDKEWGRLAVHRTEFAVTLRALADYLPPPPATLADVGGGPGRYAIALARQGYLVTLVDLSQQLLRRAEEETVRAGVELRQTMHADARDLQPLADDAFDAVLLMGPLYHLPAAADRAAAVAEALRVLHPGGPLFASFITRFAPFRDAVAKYPDWLVENLEYAESILETGVHTEGTVMPETHFAHPEEIVPFMEGCGLQTLLLLGCEGVVAGHEEAVNKLQGEEWEIWVDLNYRLGHEPTLLGAADHLLYVGRQAT